jgi:hypothetical protein
MIAKAIGLPSVKWGAGGTAESGTGQLLSDLGNEANPAGALGIAAAEDPGAQTPPITNVKMLAYQHTDQTCGYYPSSTANANDMINVRQGRYVIWGPEHIIVNVDANGNPVDSTGAPNAALTALMNLFIETGPAPVAANSSSPVVSDAVKQTIIQSEATAGVVPWCAMQVSRSTEIGPESSYQPVEPCGCYFESILGGTTTTCTPCTTDDDCAAVSPTAVCRYTFCEAQ